MSSGKNEMLGMAQRYSQMITAANGACADAASSLSKSMDKIAENWEGDSATAMLEVLGELQIQIHSLSGRLEALANQMTTHAWGIYYCWPEEGSSAGGR